MKSFDVSNGRININSTVAIDTHVKLNKQKKFSPNYAIYPGKEKGEYALRSLERKKNTIRGILFIFGWIVVFLMAFYTPRKHFSMSYITDDFFNQILLICIFVIFGIFALLFFITTINSTHEIYLGRDKIIIKKLLKRITIDNYLLSFSVHGIAIHARNNKRDVVIFDDLFNKDEASWLCAILNLWLQRKNKFE